MELKTPSLGGRIRAREELDAARRQYPAPPLPKALHRSLICTLPRVFQFRDAWAADNVTRMTRDLRESKKPFKEPLKVTWAPGEDGAERWAVVDGHHRLAAYGAAGWDKPIKVTVIEALEDAIAEARRSNKNNTAFLSEDARLEMAWQMVCEEVHTNVAIVEQTGVAKRTVPNLKKELEEFKKARPRADPKDFKLFQVRKMKKDVREYSEAGHEAASLRRIEETAEALRKTKFDPLMHLPELVEALRQIDPELPGNLLMHLTEADLTPPAPRRDGRLPFLNDHEENPDF